MYAFGRVTSSDGISEQSPRIGKDAIEVKEVFQGTSGGWPDVGKIAEKMAECFAIEEPGVV